MRKISGAYKNIAILVWRFYDAPRDLRKLSGHGGDEDWLAFVPTGMDYSHIGWLESGSPFGVCEVSKHETANGTVYIGAHA